MRNAFIIALGVASIGVINQFAAAEPLGITGPSDCGGAYMRCTAKGGTTVYIDLCIAAADVCTERNRKLGYDMDGVSMVGGNAGAKDGAKGGGSRPKPGAHRTADGGTIMVTPEGKEWVWNGKTTTVVLFSRSNSAEYITVKQGDPDVSLTKVVNGRRYNVADPAYAAAVAAEQAKASGSKGGSKGGTNVGHHPPVGPASGGVATFNSPAQPTPVAGAGAVGGGADASTSVKANAKKAPAPQKQNSAGNILGHSGILGADRLKLHAN